MSETLMPDEDHPKKPDLKKNLKALEALAYRKKFWRMDFFEPYPKQAEFFALGKENSERVLIAGNQLGKTMTASYETAVHLTGRYPDWWKGRTWNRAVRGVAAGVSALVVRDTSQKLLCGDPGVESMFGTGMIPKELFADKPSLARGVTDAYDTVQVKHISGGVSKLMFKAYEQGREKFQGDTLDFFWDDEEMPLDVYIEQLVRISATSGMAYSTFTPIKSGQAVKHFSKIVPGRKSLIMTVDDAKHVTPEMLERDKARYPKYQWKTRFYGIPMAGEGAVFELDEDAIKEPPITDIPEYWYKIWGIDFGILHPFAAVLLLWDRDADVIHVHQAIRIADQGVLAHAKAIKMIAANIPVAWPQDGTAREKSSGNPLSKFYKDEGLRMLPDHATWEDGGISTEAGILELQQRMISGRFKVASTLTQWFEEFRSYHRKDGQIVKIDDDLLSATRIGLMMKRHAKQEVLGAGNWGMSRRHRHGPDIADGLTFSYPD